MPDVISPMPGTVVVVAAVGDAVGAGATVVVLESMKMEHVVAAGEAGRVRSVAVKVGDTVTKGQILAELEPGDAEATAAATTPRLDLEEVRSDTAEVLDRHARLEDARRTDAVTARRKRDRRTARENLADLVDEGSFLEYGGLAVAAQSRRRAAEDLIAKTSTDGIICGLGTINAAECGADAAASAVMIYDYTVLAGTQGYRTHQKKDRLLRLALERRLPTVLYAEGGGGRPGDVDVPAVAGLDVPTFGLLAQMSGRAPTVAVVAGYCFAGNAVLAGLCDVIIATEDSNLGGGGPAMIEGGGLGVVAPTDIGPIDDQVASGVVDIRVADEAAATAMAKRYLSYFQGPVAEWSCADQRELRTLVPENRVRSHDIRRIIDVVADTDSVLELRPDFGDGMVTALIRVEGVAMGLLANNPHHLGGAIDGVGADKAARFMQLCDAYGLPIAVLCDTPGIMVGPEAEREATVRRASRMFVVGANTSVPVGTVVVRKGYGLGAQAMAAGGFKANDFTIGWPTSEFGGMNLEGAVRLGFRKELDAITDHAEREVVYQERLAAMYERGRGLSMASYFEIDDVIDPADTRRWLVGLAHAAPEPAWRSGDHRPWVL
ncbi:MAG: biotin/lipoyl-binding protein [Acidimicrobiales bacterium]|nr:biotin/lipoyl-binding protein [Acidimicrobiales bacterium]